MTNLDNEDEEYQQLKAEFDQYYDKQLYPLLKQKEDIRLKYVSRFWFLVLMCCVILPMTMLIVYVCNYYFHKEIDWAVVYMLAAIMVWVLRSPIAACRREVKNDVMDKLIRFFPGFSYQNGHGLNQPLMQQSRIFPKYDQLEADDGFSGRFEDVGICVYEQTLKQEFYNSKGKKHIKKVFQGVALDLSMRKPFSGQTIVVKDGGLFHKIIGFEDLQRVKLEDPLFEKQFDVYASDQIEARYLLTTAFMERALKLKELYKGKKIELSFFANRLMIAIDTRENMFEPCAFFKTNLNKQRVDLTFEQIRTILSIIRILKLNQNIGL